MKNVFKKIIEIIVALGILLTPNLAQAGQVSFQPSEMLSTQANPFTTTLVLNTTGDSVNTVEGMLKVEERVAEGLELSDSGSIVTYWVEQPKFDPATGVVRFAGAIPGGYNGSAGILFSLIFKPHSGESIEPAISVSQFKAYKNDGAATSANISSANFKLGNIAGQIDSSVSDQLYLNGGKKDDIPPEIFNPKIARSDDAHNGKWFISFSTVDKQSGIDHYEIQESRSGSMDTGRWKTVSSPYVLEDQNLSSFVYVIAVDRQGNERIIKVFPRNPLTWLQLYGKEVGGILLLLLAIGLIVWRRKRNASKTSGQNAITNPSPHKSMLKIFLGLAIGMVGFVVFGFVNAPRAEAATFSVTPGNGSYAVGSTFDVSIILNTEGQNVNALQVELAYPPDKLQLVSPQVGNSIIEIYTSPPRYDNQNGIIEIVGGIPNGINSNSGLIAKLTFRVRSLGSANLRFTGESKALLNDGAGTNALNNTIGATYKLDLPPAQGPLVLSDSHPDQEVWYRNNNVNLRWDEGLPPAEGYSYTISDNATDIPDDVSETANTNVDYRAVPDGINYFHIKALRDGRWGGVTRYTLRIDTTPPADFKIKVSPSARTYVTQPVLQFASSDSLSGFDRYEIKIIALKINGREGASGGDGQLFTEAQSPYQTPELLYGNYEIIVRAYDKAGNIRDVSQRVEITDSWLWFVGPNGVTLLSGKQIPWKVFLPVAIGLLLLLIVLAILVWRWFRHHHIAITEYKHPEHIEEKLAELQYYRQKYGKIATGFLVAIILSAVVGMNLSGSKARAAEIAPPTIETYSQYIKDDELFYVSGRTVEPNTEVVIHLQSMVDGQAFDFASVSDKRGDWIYRHNSFLPGGRYIIWTHSKVGQELSVPSPQVELDVKPVAINWGGSRITYQTIYLVAISVLVVTVVLLTIFIIIGTVLARRRRKQFAHTVQLAEDGLRHGFTAIKRDLEAELALMHRATMGGELAGEANVRADQLRQDLKNIEEIVNREAGEVDRFAGLPPNNMTSN